jgi:tetratricopeptide (TPR) repeat protein
MNNLGSALAQKREFDAAIDYFKRAVRLKPDFALAHSNLANTLFVQGRTREALPHFRAGGADEQNDPKLTNNVAWMLATDPDPQLRDATLAVQFAERARHLTGGQEPNTLDTLAAAYAEAGRFAKAREMDLEAIRLAESLGDHKTARQIQEHLKVFQQNRPLKIAPATTSPKP